MRHVIYERSSNRKSLLKNSNLDQDVSLEKEVSLNDLLETFGRIQQLADDCVLQVILEHFLRVLEGLRLALGRPVHPLVSRFVVVGFRAQDQRLD